MTSLSTAPPTRQGGGRPPSPLPAPQGAQITVTTRRGARVTVSTWTTCQGVADFVASLLGEPASRVEATP